MVSIITCTMRDSCLENVLDNYDRQKYNEKELIIVLTKKDMDVERWKNEATRYKHVSVFQITDPWSLGKCLNYAIQHAKYEFIANFEDDDYYTSDYLRESLDELQKKSVDVIGKTTVYLYMPERKVLTIFNPNNEYQYVNDQTSVGKQYLQGGTLLFKREVIGNVPFRDQVRELDRLFCRDCVKIGYRVYSAGKDNFVYIRNDSKEAHTWKVSNDLLLMVNKVIAYTDDYKHYLEKGSNNQRGEDE